MKKNRAYLGFITPGFILYTLFMIIPIVFAMYYSFFEWNGIGPMKFIGLGNFQKLLGGGRMSRIFFNALGNNIKYLICVLLIITPLQIFFAYLLFIKIKGHRYIQFMLFLPYVISTSIVGFFALILVGFIAPDLMMPGFACMVALTITMIIYQPFKSIIINRSKGRAAPISLMKLFGLVMLYLIGLYLLKEVLNFSTDLYAILLFFTPIIFNALAVLIPKPRPKIYMEKENRKIHHVKFHIINSASEYTKHFSPHELASLKDKMIVPKKEFTELVKNNQVGIDIVAKDD